MSGVFEFLKGCGRQVVTGGKAYKAWIAFLLVTIAVGGAFYGRQWSHGLIATNTTIDREAVKGHRHASQAGGLSGRPLLAPSTAILRKLAGALGGRVPLIGVGGIMSGEDARAKILHQNAAALMSRVTKVAQRETVAA